MTTQTQTAPRPVARDEFMQLARAAGWSDDSADRACQSARLLGNSVLVGSELVRLDVFRSPGPLWEQ